MSKSRVSNSREYVHFIKVVLYNNILYETFSSRSRGIIDLAVVSRSTIVVVVPRTGTREEISIICDRGDNLKNVALVVVTCVRSYLKY